MKNRFTKTDDADEGEVWKRYFFKRIFNMYDIMILGRTYNTKSFHTHLARRSGVFMIIMILLLLLIDRVEQLEHAGGYST